jgi:hypothetical protein
MKSNNRFFHRQRRSLLTNPFQITFQKRKGEFHHPKITKYYTKNISVHNTIHIAHTHRSQKVVLHEGPRSKEDLVMKEKTKKIRKRKKAIRSLCHHHS